VLSPVHRSEVTVPSQDSATPATKADAGRQSPPVPLLSDSAETLHRKLQGMPDCAERTLLTAIHYLRFDVAHSKPDGDHMRTLFARLREQLKDERFPCIKMGKVISIVEQSMEYSSPAMCADLLQGCFRDEIQQIDVDFLVELLARGSAAAQHIADKDVVLLIGTSGAGKTTTVHWVAGSDMELEIKDGKEHLRVVRSVAELHSFVASAGQSSETYSINPLDIVFRQQKSTVCDTPGYKDNRGLEFALANGLGVMEAVRRCRSVRLVFVVSMNSTGDRMDELIETLRSPIAMMESVAQHLPSFSYWFTKGKDYKGNTRIRDLLQSKLDVLRRERTDVAMIAILQDMVDKINQRGGVADVIDPLSDIPDQLLAEVLSTPAITEPFQAFRHYAAPDNLDKLKAQLINHVRCIDACVTTGKFAVVAYKLTQLKEMWDCLQLEECHSAYFDSVKRVRIEAQGLLIALQDRMQNCGTVCDFSVEAQLRKSAAEVRLLFEMEAIRREHFADLPEFPSSCTTMVTSAQRDLAGGLQAVSEASAADPMMLVQNTDRWNLSALAGQLNVMALMMTTFTTVTAPGSCTDPEQRGCTELDSAQNMVQQLSDIYSATQATLSTLVIRVIEQFTRSTVDNDVATCAQCLNMVKEFKDLFSRQLSGANAAVNCAEAYAQLCGTLLKLVKTHHDAAIGVLSQAPLHELDQTRVAVVHAAAAVTQAGCGAVLAAHYGPQDAISSFFPSLKATLLRGFKSAQVELIEVHRRAPATAFTEIKSRLQTIVMLRSSAVVCDSTIQAYSDVTETVRKIVQGVQTSLNNLLLTLEVNNWEVDPATLLSLLQQLRSAEALSDLPGDLYSNEFHASEQRLCSIVKTLADAIRQTDFSVPLPDTVQRFSCPLRVVAALKQYYSAGAAQQQTTALNTTDGTGDSSSTSSLLHLLVALENQFSSKMCALLSSLERYFPVGGDLTIHQMDLPLTWAATRVAAIAQGFACVDCSALTVRVQRFAAVYAEQLGAAITSKYTAAIDELSAVNDAVLNNKRQSAQGLAKLLAGIGAILSFYEMHAPTVAQPSGAHNARQPASGDAGELRLLSTVFGGALRELYDSCLNAADGAITTHLMQYCTINASHLGYADIMNKWQVARAMAAVDYILPRGAGQGAARSYEGVVHALEGAIRALKDSVSTDIKLENYEKVSEFFGARDLKDPLQAENLAVPLKELSEKVKGTLAEVKRSASRTTATLHNLAMVLAVVAGLNKLRSAQKYVLSYLELVLQTSIAAEILSIEDNLLLAAKGLTVEASAAIANCEFAPAEQLLQATQQILEAMFGSVKGYDDVMGRRGVAPADRLDISRIRSRVAAVIGSSRAVFELIVQDVTRACTAATNRAAVPTAAAWQGAGGWASRVAQLMSNLVTEDEDSDSESTDVTPTLASADQLKEAFRAHSPKLLCESLLSAASYGHADLYKQEEDAYTAFMKAKLFTLSACCQDRKLSRDYQERLLQALRDSLPFLPAKLVADVTACVTACDAAIAADKEAVQRQLDEAQRTDDLEYMIGSLLWYTRAFQWSDCNACKNAISIIIRKSVALCEEDLRTGKVASVLSRLPKAWRKWMAYFNQSAKTTKEYDRCRRYSANPQYINNLGDSSLKTAVANMAAAVGIALRASFSKAQTTSNDDPQIFPVLAVQFDLAVTLSTDIVNDGNFSDLADSIRRDLGGVPLLSPLFEKVVACFRYYTSHIVAMTSDSELNAPQLLLHLENYSKSEALYNKVVEFAHTVHCARYQLQNFQHLHKSFTTIKNTVVTDMFTAMVRKVKKTLLHNAELATADTNKLTLFYAGLLASYMNLSRSAVLQQYVNPAVAKLETMEKECDDHFAAELRRLGAFLTGSILGSTSGLNLNNQEKFSMWFDNLALFKEAFNGTTPGQVAGDVMHEVQQEFLATVQNMVDAASEPLEDAELADRLCEIKQLTVTILRLKNEVDMKLDELLNYIRTKNRHGAQRILNLGVILSSNLENPVAQMIVNQQKAFEGSQLLLFNTKVARSTAQDLLGELRGDGVDCGLLQTQCVLFKNEYEALVRVGLLDPAMATRKCIERSKEIASNAATLQVETNTVSIDNVRSLMVQLFVHWTLSNSGHYFDATCGESGQEVGEESKQKYLQQPHAGQVLAIFRMLGFDAGGQVRNHFVQIGTGEGKSVVIAILACIFALLGYGVDCACYSEYLSKRDCAGFAQQFREFGVHEYIQYNTFYQLGERFLNSAGDIRVGVEAILQTPPNKSWTRGQAKPSRFSTRRKRILVIDEADVFFNKDFYGNAYRPLAKLADLTVTALLDKIWAVRTTNPRLTAIKDTPEYKACSAKYGKWQVLLEEAVKSLLYDLPNFESHEVKIVGDRIGYKDQDGVSFDITYGYKTLFAYYKANADGKISAASLQRQKCLAIDCGSFSFAEIPKLYDVILGVSGTLETLSAPEQQILHGEYKIQLRTYMPSVYSSNNMDFHASDDVRDVKIESSSSHFAAITNEINLRREAPKAAGVLRPVLVFFETAALLQQYVASPAAIAHKARFRIITEETSESDKSNFVRLATALGAITLLTREFGRGTDFFIYDEHVRAAGGLHVIQTFLSEERSEETQIRGRAARQGCRGSYSMVLSQLPLEKFGIQRDGTDSVQEMKTRKNYEEVLTKKRDAYFCNKYNETISYVDGIRKDHHLAMAFTAELAKVPLESEAGAVVVPEATVKAISSFFCNRNKCSALTQARMTSRTLVLMDATGSMSALLDKAKNSVKTMFTEARSVLAQASGCEGLTFEVQFAVYRNYNAPAEHLLQYSGWEADPQNLFTFMDTITPAYGMGSEAIEVGLWHVNNEVARKRADQRYQVILIGDMPPNSREEVAAKRGGRGEAYWGSTKFKQATHYEAELRRLVTECVPVHAFYVNTNAREAFSSIASASRGSCLALDVHSRAGGETLTGLVTERILNDVGGGGTVGQTLVEDYRRMFPKGYMK
jgi:hypothetical protein